MKTARLGFVIVFLCYLAQGTQAQQPTKFRLPQPNAQESAARTAEMLAQQPARDFKNSLNAAKKQKREGGQDKMFVAASMAYWGCGALESISTDSRAKRQALIWSIRGGLYTVFWLARKDHPKITKTMLWGGAAVSCAVGVSNLRQ